MAMHARTDLDGRTVTRLRELTQLNIDSRDGFDYAAERIEDDAPLIADRFREFSDQRSRNAEQLENVLVHSGENVPEDGSWTATMHRTWMNIRDMLDAKPDIYAIVAEAERGEDVIQQAYEEAVREIDSGLGTLINDHCAGVRRAHTAVRELRDSLKQVSSRIRNQSS